MEQLMVKVSIVMPCYNEVRYISQCLDSIIAGNFPKDSLELLIYDGGSTDGTLEILSEYKKRNPFLKVRRNPKKIQSVAMNLGIKEAKGEIIIRMDAHTLYNNDYISQVVNLLTNTDAVNVGGPQVGIGGSYVADSIAMAVSSPFVAGNAAYRFEKIKDRFVDTVYLGAWRKEDLLKAGSFDESFVVNEDYELNYRIRAMGGKILLSPKIKSKYFVRGSFLNVIKQYFRYGFWKIKTLKKHSKSLALRQLAAPAFVLALSLSIALLFTGYEYFLLGISAAYILAFLLFAFKALNIKELKYLPMFFVLAFSIHLSWGIGFWYGTIYWSFRYKNNRKGSS
ncbi:MAG: glycosyltransferase family 2 protein [Candidatus Aureabacteria bacterium]|nr:glycosyltransferase family 2 protein [Candidatus Auribacterota bacterium]